MKAGRILPLLLGAGLILAASVGVKISADQLAHDQRPVASTTTAALGELARSFAANADDPNAADTAEAVSTTHLAALDAVLATSLVTNESVFLVQMHGNFVGRMAKIPPGFRPPRGSYLYFIVDQAQTVLDWGISNHVANLASLGQAFALRS